MLWIGRERANRLQTAGAEFIAVGTAKAGGQADALVAAGVTHVVNAGAFAYKRHPAVQYLDIEVQDSLDEDLLRHFEETNAFLAAAARAGGLALVHCAAGRSRSAALVVAFLVGELGMELEASLAAVRAARPIAEPNPSFRLQLAEYASSCSHCSRGGMVAPAEGREEEQKKEKGQEKGPGSDPGLSATVDENAAVVVPWSGVSDEELSTAHPIPQALLQALKL